MENIKCKICGNIKDNKMYNIKEMHFGIGEVFEYFECSKCNCIQIKDIPENLSLYYPVNYYSFNCINENYISGIRERVHKYFKIKRDRQIIDKSDLIGFIISKMKPVTNQKLNSLKDLNLKLSDNILDVGCGNGEFLYELKELGFKNLKGIDPFLMKKTVYKNGLVIEKKRIEDLLDSENKFDLIMFHHVLEHIPNPMDILKICYKLLNTKGVLLIRVPVSEALVWKEYRENWVQLDAPRHLYIYSRNSINLLAGESCFKIDNIVFDSNEFQFIASEQYKNGITLLNEKSYYVNVIKSGLSKEKIDYYKKLSKELNFKKEGDQAIFYLSKKNPAEKPLS